MKLKLIASSIVLASVGLLSVANAGTNTMDLTVNAAVDKTPQKGEISLRLWDENGQEVTSGIIDLGNGFYPDNADPASATWYYVGCKPTANVASECVGDYTKALNKYSLEIYNSTSTAITYRTLSVTGYRGLLTDPSGTITPGNNSTGGIYALSDPKQAKFGTPGSPLDPNNNIFNSTGPSDSGEHTLDLSGITQGQSVYYPLMTRGVLGKSIYDSVPADKKINLTAKDTITVSGSWI